MHRRDLLRTAGLGAALGLAPVSLAGAPGPVVLKPPRLRPGSTVGFVSPAGVTLDAGDVDAARATFARLGFETVVAPHALAQVGYFAGTDEERAADLMAFVLDDRIDGMLSLRGGWGSARILPHLDFDAFRARPKVLCGFSDVTALVNAVYARAGVVAFHGPNALSRFDPFTLASFRSVVVDGDAALLETPSAPAGRFSARGLGEARQVDTGPVTIRPGRARGPLLGGNLSVVASLVGTPYLPDPTGHVLFVEDVGEGIYRLDRMLTQLAQGGVLDGLAGFVFGVCPRCDPDSGDVESFTLEEVVRQHVEPLGIPAAMGLAIGHTSRKLTVPVGVPAELDAGAATLRLLEPAVV